MQPATRFSVARTTLANGSAAGTVDLYGNCRDPNDVLSCAYYGYASLSGSWTSSGGTTSWSQSQNVTDTAQNKYSFTNNGAWRPATATGSATLNGVSWTLGRTLHGRITRYNITASLTCPTRCPSSLSGTASPQALMKFNDLSQQQSGDKSKIPLKELHNAEIGNTASLSIAPDYAPYLPFDFSSFYASSPLPIDPALVNYYYNAINPYITYMFSSAPNVYAGLGDLQGLISSVRNFAFSPLL